MLYNGEYVSQISIIVYIYIYRLLTLSVRSILKLSVENEKLPLIYVLSQVETVTHSDELNDKLSLISKSRVLKAKKSTAAYCSVWKRWSLIDEMNRNRIRWRLISNRWVTIWPPVTSVTCWTCDIARPDLLIYSMPTLRNRGYVKIRSRCGEQTRSATYFYANFSAAMLISPYELPRRGNR
jgi:hypothetical protein